MINIDSSERVLTQSARAVRTAVTAKTRLAAGSRPEMLASQMKLRFVLFYICILHFAFVLIKRLFLEAPVQFVLISTP